MHQTLESGAIFSDPFASKILDDETLARLDETAADPSLRPMRLFIAARSRFSEETLAACVARGVRQIGRARSRPRYALAAKGRKRMQKARSRRAKGPSELKIPSAGKPSGNLSVLPHVGRVGGHMLRNGSYSAWFRTRQDEGTGAMQGEGTGVIALNDGKVTGGDTVLAYTGSYVVEGDKFTASIATERHTPGQPSVFGIDDVNLTLTGKSTPTTASCTGTAKQAPGLTFEATLIRIADQPRALPRAPTRARSPAFVILNPSEIARDARSKK
jgi:hypothetical protein